MSMIRIRLEEPGHPTRATEIRSLPATIGRAPSNHIVIDRPFVSARHGEIFSTGREVFYADLGSTNGSRLVRLGESTAVRPGTSRANPLNDGDRIVLGNGKQALVMHIESLATAPGPVHLVPPTLVAARVPAHPSAAAATKDNLLQALSILANRAALVKTVLEVDHLIASTCLEVFGEATHVTLADGSGGHGDASPTRVLARGAPQFEDGPALGPTAREAIERHEAVLVTDTNAPSVDAPPLQTAAVRSMIAVPLFHSQVGILQVESRKRSHAFDENDLDLLMLLAGQYSSVRLRLARETYLQGHCNDLTEANRHLSSRGTEPMFAGPSLHAFLETLEPVLGTDVTVLVTGETGAGKELIARHIHENSSRATETFWAINCAALSDSLLQDELFGHIKGAFTGADSGRKGIFELAHRGTLFLDEIGELNEGLQSKLLRVIETGEVWRLGSERPIRVSTRIIAATNRDLREEVARGRFRADLYYRLAVFLAPVPSLRDCPGDIVPMAEHLLSRLARGRSGPPVTLSDEAKAGLLGHSWPGNVRELRNELERASLRLRGRTTIELSDLSLHSTLATPAPAPVDVPNDAAVVVIPPGGAPLEVLERQIFEHTLNMFSGQQTKAARALGMKYTTFRFRAKKVGAL